MTRKNRKITTGLLAMAKALAAATLVLQTTAPGRTGVISLIGVAAIGFAFAYQYQVEHNNSGTSDYSEEE